MNQLGTKLAEALETRDNDINTYIWKGPRVEKNREKVQEEIRLIDASEEQLKSFLTHCNSMLNSTDKTNPGRIVLLNIIKIQREKCNTELFLKWLENTYLPTDRLKIQRFSFLQDLRSALDQQQDKFPKNLWNMITIGNFVKGLPSEFKNITIDNVIEGCLDTLGLFDKKHITLSFIIKLGLWFDADEKKDFAEESKATGKSRSEIVKERCGLKSTTVLKINPIGALNFKEFKAMITLRNKKYSEMTIDQLLVLRNKILFHLENEVSFHKTQWERRIKQIKAVASAKNFNI